MPRKKRADMTLEELLAELRKKTKTYKVPKMSENDLALLRYISKMCQNAIVPPEKLSKKRRFGFAPAAGA